MPESYVLRTISPRLYRYLGCSSNPYLGRRYDERRGLESFYWFGPSGVMYRPMPGRPAMTRPS